MADNKQSAAGSLNSRDVDQWLNNTKVFLAPLVFTYFGAVALIIQQPGHRFALTDFVPTNNTIGIMVLYVVNVAFNLARKIVAGNA